MSQPRLLICIGQHLSTAPRPQKEAAAAKAAGFEVHIIGTWWSDRLAAEDLKIAQELGVTYQAVVDIRPGQSGRFMQRVWQKLARLLFDKFRIFSPRLLGVGTPALLATARAIKADLTMVHSEGGLWMAERLIKDCFTVGVDFEDWFSQDVPEQDRQGRPVQEIQRLERALLRSARLSFTTSQAMADALAADASVDVPPIVLPNAFPWRLSPLANQSAERHGATVKRDQRSADAVSFYWFSQTIGHARGLEALAQALGLLQGNWELHLRGNSETTGAWIEQTFGAFIGVRVFVHPPSSNADLPELSAAHDVGLALEIPYAANKNLTASNKIFEYLRCGLAVIATDTEGQQEVMARCPDAGMVTRAGNVSELAKAMQTLIDDRERLRQAKQAAVQAASTFWAWEAFEPTLQQALKDAVCKAKNPLGYR